MLDRPDNFIYHFFILFLIILLSMGLMFIWMINSESKQNFSELFRVNLFIIDLCLLILVETFLIYVFFRFTVISVTISMGLLIVFVSFGKKILTRQKLIQIFSPFADNKYATLGLSDAIILFILNSLILSFLITVILKEKYEEKLLSQSEGKRGITEAVSSEKEASSKKIGDTPDK